MKLTKLQEKTQEHLACGESVLLVAPTGIGKTRAVTADLLCGRKRIVYGVPLRGLTSGILDEVEGLKRHSRKIEGVVHHGDIQGSWLFSEEVAVTTYDQVICAVPGLPLSLPLSAGHAVAGALLMSRLVLDEVHLAWGISPEALTILLGIVEFRKKLGLQTVLMTATMPKNVAKIISESLRMALIVAGEDDTKDDEALIARNRNRRVAISYLKVKGNKAQENEIDLTQVAATLRTQGGKRIYFANTVERLQQMYDLLQASGFNMDQVAVLHNRMPSSWRSQAEALVRQRFGKNGPDDDGLLLTNQVAEAGLDISAPLVMSDPAPVDTLIQRAGRCARWFRESRADGVFTVIDPPKASFGIWAIPYRSDAAELALESLKEITRTSAEPILDWNAEKEWIDQAWSGKKKKDGTEQVSECLQKTTFALNLFDRASQQHSPGAIASTFREILSVQVAVIEDREEQADSDILLKLKTRYDLDSSAVSLRRGYALLTAANGKIRVVRYRDELEIEKNPSNLRPGDLLLVPPNVAYLDKSKGLCFGDGLQVKDAILKSEFVLKPQRSKDYSSDSHPQSLWKHTQGVMRRVHERLLDPGDYRSAMEKILEHLEPLKDAKALADLIGRLAVLATGFHDLGKCGRCWQRRAHEIDPGSLEELIGRTSNTAKAMGVPHTPPSFFAAVAACNAALGNMPEADHLVRAIALAAARHHSSLLDPAGVRGYQFDPVEASSRFVDQVLESVGLELDATKILGAARSGGRASDVPLMLPNDDLFPIYALVGRAILISDREDAASRTLESWRFAGNV